MEPTTAEPLWGRRRSTSSGLPSRLALTLGSAPNHPRTAQGRPLQVQFSSCRPESSPSRQRLRRAHAATLRIVRRHPQSEFERQVHELRARHPLAASHSPRPHRVAGAAPKPHSAVLELHALLDRHFAPHELAREERAYADRGDEDQAREGAQPRDAADGVLGRRLLVVRHRRHADGFVLRARAAAAAAGRPSRRRATQSCKYGAAVARVLVVRVVGSRPPKVWRAGQWKRISARSAQRSAGARAQPGRLAEQRKSRFQAAAPPDFCNSEPCQHYLIFAGVAA